MPHPSAKSTPRKALLSSGPLSPHVREALNKRCIWFSQRVLPISPWSCEESSFPRILQFLFVHFSPLTPKHTHPQSLTRLKDLPCWALWAGLRAMLSSSSWPQEEDRPACFCQSPLAILSASLSWALWTTLANVVLQACLVVYWKSVKKFVKNMSSGVSLLDFELQLCYFLAENLAKLLCPSAPNFHNYLKEIVTIPTW